MFKALKRLNPFYRKRRYNKFTPHLKINHYSCATDTRVNKLESKIDRLIVLSGFEEVKGVIMDEHDAKKYQDQKYSH
jgi:hypothetical protein